MARKAKKQFVTKEQLWEGYCQWRDSAVDVNDRTLSDQFALNIWKIAEHLTTHHKFVGYSQTIKDDMISDAYLKVVINLKNVKEQYKDSLFSYFTNCAWCAFITYLQKHYKQVNLKRQLILDALQNMNDELPNDVRNELAQELENQLREYNGEE